MPTIFDDIKEDEWRTTAKATSASIFDDISEDEWKAPEASIGRTLSQFGRGTLQGVGAQATAAAGQKSGQIQSLERSVAGGYREQPTTEQRQLAQAYFSRMTEMDKAEYGEQLAALEEKGPLTDEAKRTFMSDFVLGKMKGQKKDAEKFAASMPEFLPGTPEGFGGYVEEVAKGISTTAVPVLMNFVPGLQPAATAIVFQTLYGFSYGKYLKEGIDEQTARDAALISASAQTVLEQGGNILQVGAIKSLLSPKGAGRFLSFLTELPKTGLIEAGEEYTQTFAEAAADVYAKNPNGSMEDWTKAYKEKLPEIKKEAKQASKIGLGGGLLLGGAGGAVTGTMGAMSDRQQRKEQEATPPPTAPTPETIAQTILADISKGAITVEQVKAALPSMPEQIRPAIEKALSSLGQQAPQSKNKIGEGIPEFEPQGARNFIAKPAEESAEVFGPEPTRAEEAFNTFERAGLTDPVDQQVRRRNQEVINSINLEAEAEIENNTRVREQMAQEAAKRRELETDQSSEEAIAQQREATQAADEDRQKAKKRIAALSQIWDSLSETEQDKALDLVLPQRDTVEEQRKQREATRVLNPDEIAVEAQRKLKEADRLGLQLDPQYRAELEQKAKAKRTAPEPRQSPDYSQMRQTGAWVEPNSFSQTGQNEPLSGLPLTDEPQTALQPAAPAPQEVQASDRKDSEPQTPLASEDGGTKEPVKLGKLKSGESATTRFGVAGMSDTFEISLSNGAKVSGYYKDQDFPGDKSKSDRAEIFLTTVPESERGKGVGYALNEDALRLVHANGAKTVNMSATSKGGQAIIDKMVRAGLVRGPIRKAQSGKGEYEITIDLQPAATTQKPLDPGGSPTTFPERRKEARDTPDRRQDAQKRKRWDEMTDEERRVAYFTDELTDLPNRRAYQEAKKQPVQGMTDIDSLKWVNDNLGHEAGDQLMVRIAEAFRSAGIEAYRVGGDEIAVQGMTENEVATAMQRVYDYLEKNPVTIKQPTGKTFTLIGGVSYGTGKTSTEADQALQADKQRREATGERAPRGERPARLVEESAEGNRVDNQRESGGGEGVAKKLPKKGLRLKSKPKKAAPQEPTIEIEATGRGEKTVSVDMPQKQADALSPKEQKAYLLAEVDKALKDASTDEGYYPAPLDRLKWTDEKEAAKQIAEHNQFLVDKYGTITIEVPGDGVFTLINHRTALQQFKKKIPSGFSTSTTQRPKIASTKEKGVRLSGEIEYYNEFSPRKAGVLERNDGKQFYKDGYFSNGTYLIKIDSPKELKNPYDETRNLKKKIDDDFSKTIPAKIVGEYNEIDNQLKPFAHAVSVDGKTHSVIPAEQADSILTKYPDADVFIAKGYTYPPVVFKKGGEIVGVVMPLNLVRSGTKGDATGGDLSVFDRMPDFAKERYAEIYGGRKGGKTKKDSLSTAIANILKNETGSSQLITDIAAYGADLIRKGTKTLIDFTAAMRKRFGDVWEKIKPHIKAIWEAMKDESGQIVINQGKPQTTTAPPAVNPLIAKYFPKGTPPSTQQPQQPPGNKGAADEGGVWGRATPLMDELVFQAQDRFNYLAKAQKGAAKDKGVSELPEAQDAYLAELRYHGMVGAALDQFQEDHVTPLLDVISKSGLEMDALNEFLHARHAKEANAHLKAINLTKAEVDANIAALKTKLESIKQLRAQIRSQKPNDYPVDKKYRKSEKDMEDIHAEIDRLKNYTPVADNTALSGMTDAEADAILAKSKGKYFDEIGKRVDAITKAERDLLRSSGLEKNETIDAWEAVYEHYVPLMRDGKGSKMPRKGRGYDTRGAQKRRAGSTREVVDILANVVAKYEATTIRAEKAKVGRAFLQFASDNKGPWKVDQVEYAPSFNKDGLVVYRPNTAFRLADNVLVVRVNGEEHHITFDEGDHNGMRICSALKNLGSGDSGPLVNILSRMTRWLALVNTGLNPEFIISNFARDIQTAGYNMSDSEAHDIKFKAIKQVGSARKGIRNFQKGDKSSEWSQWFDQFRKAGAQTGWIEAYGNIEQREKKLIKMVNSMRPGSMNSVRRGFRATMEFIDNHNTAVENAIRLSVFKNLVESGKTTEAKAARIAKELTVNFNRKGNMGQALNALYLFYNASIQGSARILVAAAKSAKVRRLMYATVAFATVLDLFNRMIGGEDDDGKDRYDKIKPWIKERNLIVMLPSGKGSVMLPLPWGYNVLHVIGQGIGEMLTKKNSKVSDSALRVAGATVSAFNPVGGESSLLQLITPTIVRPVVQWAENKDWTGNKLRPDTDVFAEKPSSQLYWSSVREPSRIVAEKLNELTGGDEIRPGAIDISPEAIDLAIDTITGGAGRFVSNTVSLPIKALSGKEVETHEIPFLKKVYNKPGRSSIVQEFYENMDTVRMVERQIKHYADDPQKLSEIMSDYKKEVELIELAAKVRKKLTDYGSAKRKLKKADADIGEIDDGMQTIMQVFNKEYNKKMGITE